MSYLYRILRTISLRPYRLKHILALYPTLSKTMRGYFKEVRILLVYIEGWGSLPLVSPPLGHLKENFRSVLCNVPKNLTTISLYQTFLGYSVCSLLSTTTTITSQMSWLTTGVTSRTRSSLREVDKVLQSLAYLDCVDCFGQ